MSKADRVFSARKGQGPQAPYAEKRHILSAPRRGGAGLGMGRVVEVVHVRRDGSRPMENHSGPAPWSVRAETWPEGFRVKPAQPLQLRDSQPVASEPTQPAVHVMPVWQPSWPQPAPTEATPAEPDIEASMRKRRKPRASKPHAAKETTRHFADPFADGDDGANCLCCGYLVEPAREKRGLLTCAACG
jgi:hypothetical protein